MVSNFVARPRSICLSSCIPLFSIKFNCQPGFAQRGIQIPHYYKTASLYCLGALFDEVYYYYNVYGSAQDGTYIPAQPGELPLAGKAFPGAGIPTADGVFADTNSNASSCPATGIRYLPKNLTSTPVQNGPRCRSTRVAAPSLSGPNRATYILTCVCRASLSSVRGLLGRYPDLPRIAWHVCI